LLEDPNGNVEASPKENSGGLKLPEIPPTESKEDLSTKNEKKGEDKKDSKLPEDDFNSLVNRFNELKKR
jgi:hypothetical protein